MENNYIFGATVDVINSSKATYNPRWIYDHNDRLRRAVDTLVDGTVPTDGDQQELFHALLDGTNWHQADHYFLLMDYDSYMAAKLKAIRATKDKVAFAKMCLANIAGAGKFSSDRNIAEYWNELWRRL
jgi:starch phosphorylase